MAFPLNRNCRGIHQFHMGFLSAVEAKINQQAAPQSDKRLCHVDASMAWTMEQAEQYQRVVDGKGKKMVAAVNAKSWPLLEKDQDQKNAYLTTLIGNQKPSKNVVNWARSMGIYPKKK